MDLVPLVGSEKVGLSPEKLGLTLTLGSLSNLAMLPLAGWLADRYERKPAIVPANLISGLTLLFLASGNSPWLFLLGILLYGISSGLGGTTPAAYAADIVPRHATGWLWGCCAPSVISASWRRRFSWAEENKDKAFSVGKSKYGSVNG